MNCYSMFEDAASRIEEKCRVAEGGTSDICKIYGRNIIERNKGWLSESDLSSWHRESLIKRVNKNLCVRLTLTSPCFYSSGDMSHVRVSAELLSASDPRDNSRQVYNPNDVSPQSFAKVLEELSLVEKNINIVGVTRDLIIKDMGAM